MYEMQVFMRDREVEGLSKVMYDDKKELILATKDLEEIKKGYNNEIYPTGLYGVEDENTRRSLEEPTTQLYSLLTPYVEENGKKPFVYEGVLYLTLQEFLSKYEVHVFDNTDTGETIEELADWVSLGNSIDTYLRKNGNKYQLNDKVLARHLQTIFVGNKGFIQFRHSPEVYSDLYALYMAHLDLMVIKITYDEVLKRVDMGYTYLEALHGLPEHLAPSVIVGETHNGLPSVRKTIVYTALEEGYLVDSSTDEPYIDADLGMDFLYDHNKDYTFRIDNANLQLKDVYKDVLDTYSTIKTLGTRLDLRDVVRDYLVVY